MYYSEAEQAFHEDVREKKRTASGVHHKTGKRGYVGTMRFPTDIMSRKDKYNYRKAGKVMTTNLYDEIITIDEFERLEKDEQRNRMIHWRNQYTNKDITTGLGIWNARYYSLVAELELPKAPRSYKKREAKVKVAPVEKSKEIIPAQKEEAAQVILVNGLNLVFNGTYSPEVIQNQLLKFATLLEGETDDFYLEFRIQQKQTNKK